MLDARNNYNGKRASFLNLLLAVAKRNLILLRERSLKMKMMEEYRIS